MTSMELFSHRLLLASGGCLATGMAVWALGMLFRRYAAGIAGQRMFWLLSELTVVASFLLILLPHSERLRLVPPIELAETAPLHAAGTGAATAPLAVQVATAMVSPPTTPRAWLTLASLAWLGLYLAGLAYACAGLLRARRLLRQLAGSGIGLDALDQHAGLATQSLDRSRLTLIEVDAPISPMLCGLLRPCLLLPRHLRDFAPAQQQLIVEHELTHLRRHDLFWLSAGVFLQTLLWFNPCMRLLREQLSWAQELGCDRAVLHGRAPAARKAYATALITQLQVQQRPLRSALAFSASDGPTLATRIALIRDPQAAAPGRPQWCAVGASLAGVLLGCLALQPTLAATAALLSPANEPVVLLPAARLPAPGMGAFSCTELVDAASGRALRRDGQCDVAVTPASTFNIAVSLMGYDSGILHNEHAPRLPFKPGYPDWVPAWRATTDPSSWIDNSVLWYAQQVTTRLGATQFQDYIDSFNYGNRDLSGDPGKDNGLTLSWVSSSLTISPDQQVRFLRQLVNRRLPVSDQAYAMTLRILPSQTLANGWQIVGKTGTAAPVMPNGQDDPAHQYGWYVGWASKGQRTVVFARLALLTYDRNGYAGGRVKQAFLRALPAQLDAL